jgi:hypothetical protein
VEGGGAAAVSAQFHSEVSTEDPPAGFETFQAELSDAHGLPARGAASHPYQYITSFGVNLVAASASASSSFVPAGGDLKDIEVALPPGLVGNPTAIPRCKPQDFEESHEVLAPLRGGSSPTPITAHPAPLSGWRRCSCWKANSYSYASRSTT